MEKELRFAIREGGHTVGAGVETEILRTTKHLEQLREKRKCLEEEENEKKLGTVENIEKEFNKIYDRDYNVAASGVRFKRLKPLLSSIIYTLKNLEARISYKKKMDKIWNELKEIEVAEILTTFKDEKCDDKPRDNFTS